MSLIKIHNNKIRALALTGWVAKTRMLDRNIWIKIQCPVVDEFSFAMSISLYIACKKNPNWIVLKAKEQITAINPKQRDQNSSLSSEKKHQLWYSWKDLSFGHWHWMSTPSPSKQWWLQTISLMLLNMTDHRVESKLDISRRTDYDRERIKFSVTMKLSFQENSKGSEK